MSAHPERLLPTPGEYAAAYHSTRPLSPVLDIAAAFVDADEWRAHAESLHHDTPASQARHRATLTAAIKAHDKTRRTA